MVKERNRAASPPAAPHAAPPHAAPPHRWAEEAGGRRRRRKREEKSCCPAGRREEGKEGHGQPGRREPPAERRGRAWRGLRKGAGWLPSPRPGHRRFPTAAELGKRSLGMQQATAGTQPEKALGPGTALAAATQQSCSKLAGAERRQQHPGSPMGAQRRGDRGGCGRGGDAWHGDGNAGGDRQHAGTAAEKDTKAQLNAINKTFIQTITQYRAHFSLAFKKGFSALYNLHRGFARLGWLFFFHPPSTFSHSARNILG